MADSLAEAVSPEAYLKEVKTTTDIDKNTVSLIPFTNIALTNGYQVDVTIFFGGKKSSFWKYKA